jgi:hypothetical protein
MSEEGFRKFLRGYIEKGIPFLAYWHPAGMGLIRLDEVMVPQTPPCEGGGETGPKRPRRIGKRARQTWEKNLARLKKQSCGRVISVEFDGKEIKTEGGLNDEFYIDR